MKTKIALSILAIALVFTACQHQKDDPAIVQQSLKNWFDATKAKSLDKLNAASTKDFVLFEDGKVWKNDSMVNLMKGFKKFTGDWKFTYLKTQVEDSTAYITYFDDGNFVINDTTPVKFKWLETAGLKKVDGEWKVDFIHSTIRK